MSVFEELSKVDCSKYVEKKGQLSYLSWTFAWQELMKRYPDSTFTVHPDEHLQNGTTMVSCTVTVEGQSHTMWLPVMDNKNNSITNPDSRKISDARMRCLVKCIAMFGLGLYIYAGEDLPEAVKDAVISDENFELLNAGLDETNSNKEEFCKILKVTSLKDIPESQVERAFGMLQAKRNAIKKSQEQEQQNANP